MAREKLSPQAPAAAFRSTAPRARTEWDAFFLTLRETLKGKRLPSVSELASGKRDPFRVLVSTVLSLRTKDEVTEAAAKRLFATADTPEATLALSAEDLEKIIYPVGFYKTKAKSILAISKILIDSYASRVPQTREELLALPGVGLKTANLTLALGYGLPYICVDTHVHRISNRLGWVDTSTPEKTEAALSAILPPEYSLDINELFVLFGQNVCHPVSPRCSICPLAGVCPKRGVMKSR
jgi:endonuclease-3